MEGLSEEEAKKKMYRFVHNVILHQKFSTGFSTLLELFADNAIDGLLNGSEETDGGKETQSEYAPEGVV